VWCFAGRTASVLWLIASKADISRNALASGFLEADLVEKFAILRL